jgi:hypothetical protein
MAASSGWDYVSRCHVCTDVNRDSVRPLRGCVAPIVPCSCRVCRRQPPTLRNQALRTVHFLFNIHRFELTRDVTFQQYVFAAGSNRVDTLHQLPPQYPRIVVDCWFGYCKLHKFHSQCLGEDGRDLWRIRIDHVFRTELDAVMTPLGWRNIFFFCIRCSKPLFFPSTCRLHETPFS